MAVPAYFDAHCDTLSRLTHHKTPLFDNDYHISLKKASVFPHYAQVFAIFNDAGAAMRRTCRTETEFTVRLRTGDFSLDLDGAYAGYRAQLACLDDALAREENRLILCGNAREIERAWAQGYAAAVLAVEGAEQLARTTLEEVYRAGVRIVTLTWNYPNALGGSCIAGGGLTDAGREFVKKANALGVLIDLSHGSDALFWDVLKISKRPVLASHSNSRAVFPHRRNLTDEQFSALVRTGGAAGINLYADFLSSGSCTLSDVLRHIEHFCALGGEDHITLGTDFDGCSRLPEEIDGIADMTRLADALAAEGYTDLQIEKIFYQNLLRVFREATSDTEGGIV